MVRRSFRGREDQLHRGNCLQLGQDSLQGEGFPQGGPLVGGRHLLEIPGGQGPAGGVLRQTACGRSIGTAGTGAGVRCQDQLVILPGQGIQQSALQPAEAPVPQLEKDFQMQRVRVFRHLCFYPDPGRAALSGRDPVVHGELEHAFCKGIRQSIRREESLEPRPLLCLRQGRGHLLEAGACGTVEQRAQQVPGRGLGVQCLSGGQIQPGGGQTGPGLPAVPGGQLPEVFRSRPAASHIFRFAQQTVHISGFIE